MSRRRRPSPFAVHEGVGDGFLQVPDAAPGKGARGVGVGGRDVVTKRRGCFAEDPREQQLGRDGECCGSDPIGPRPFAEFGGKALPPTGDCCRVGSGRRECRCPGPR